MEFFPTRFYRFFAKRRKSFARIGVPVFFVALSNSKFDLKVTQGKSANYIVL